MPQKMDVSQPKLRRLSFQFLLNGTSTNNYDGISCSSRGLDQNMQAFVIANNSNKQEELRAKSITPIRQLLWRWYRISGLIQPNRNHVDLMFVLRQHIAGRQVVGRRGYDTTHVTQKPPLQRTV
ncbi:hypothetical protein SDC9_178157 [bioreactor metagenome]|uniref:Uncharacterized protein n=1 Tax=bioreactor metagenome TaxID=1076179 RepID=A0A645GWP8_9ZZZZ